MVCALQCVFVTQSQFSCHQVLDPPPHLPPDPPVTTRLLSVPMRIFYSFVLFVAFGFLSHMG